MLPILLAITASSARATDAPDEAPVVVPESATARAEHPLAAEIQSLRESTVQRLEELEGLRRKALDTEAELEIQREISRVKLDFELGMLELQLGHQQALGAKDAESELRAAIEVLQKLRGELDEPMVESHSPHQDPAGDSSR
jgi:hypothetical protein